MEVSESALMEKKMSGKRHGASVVRSLCRKGRVLLDGFDFVTQPSTVTTSRSSGAEGGARVIP